MGIMISSLDNTGVLSNAAPGLEAGQAFPNRLETTTSEPQAANPTPDNLDIQAAVKELEQISLAFNKKLRFSINHKLDEVVVEVIDRETEKIIRELPPEEIQKLHLRMREMIGILFDQSV